MPRCAVLGLGRMGGRIARRLAASGTEVTVWNRTPPADGFDGMRLAETASDAVRAAEIVLLSLHDAQSSRDVLFGRGAAAAMETGSVVFDLGTNSPSQAMNIAGLMPDHTNYCDAPVSGGTGGAEAGNLTILLGADGRLVDIAMRELAPLGRVTHMGPVGAGQAAKLANQAIVACNIAGLAEGFAAAKSMGLSLESLTAALEGGFADSSLLRLMGPRIAAGDFEARGRAVTHIKDLEGLRHELGPDAEALTATRAAMSHLQALVARHGDLDHSGMFLAVSDAIAERSARQRRETAIG